MFKCFCRRFKGAFFYVDEPEPKPQPLAGSFLAFTKNGVMQVGGNGFEMMVLCKRCSTPCKAVCDCMHGVWGCTAVDLEEFECCE